MLATVWFPCSNTFLRPLNTFTLATSTGELQLKFFKFTYVLFGHELHFVPSKKGVDEAHSIIGLVLAI